MTIAHAAIAAIACIASIHDGDSVRLCSGERIRIADIDAPELRGSPKCEHPRRSWRYPAANCDYAAGERARAALAAFLASGPVRIARQGTDRYGRTLANLTVNGHDAGAYLVQHGLARWWR